MQLGLQYVSVQHHNPMTYHHTVCISMLLSVLFHCTSSLHVYIIGFFGRLLWHCFVTVHWSYCDSVSLLGCVCTYVCVHTYIIYIYIYMLPPSPDDRPMWGRGRVMSVPIHDLPTDGRQSPLPNSIPKFPNFQHSPQPFFPKFPKCLSFPPNVKDRLCQMGHRFLDFFLEILEPCVFFVFFAIIGIFEMFGHFGNLYTFMQRS